MIQIIDVYKNGALDIFKIINIGLVDKSPNLEIKTHLKALD